MCVFGYSDAKKTQYNWPPYSAMNFNPRQSRYPDLWQNLSTWRHLQYIALGGRSVYVVQLQFSFWRPILFVLSFRKYNSTGWPVCLVPKQPSQNKVQNCIIGRHLLSCGGPRLLLSAGWRWAWGRRSPGAGAFLSCSHTWHHAVLAWASAWKLARCGHAPAPADRRPPAQRQPGLRRRRGPAHERECLPCVQ